MKKILFLSAVLLGAATASQAGVRFNLGIGIPLPTPPAVVVTPPAYVASAPTYAEPAPPVCEPAPQAYAPQGYAPQPYGPQVYGPQVYGPQVYAPPVYAPQVYAPAPVVVVGPPVIDFRVRHEPYWQHFRNEFRWSHDHDRDWRRGRRW